MDYALRLMALVAMLGGPQPYLEAVSARLIAQGHTTVASHGAADAAAAEVTIVYCDRLSGWQDLADGSLMGATVAVLAELDPSHYAKALQHGSAPVHIDTSTEIIAAVVQAALESEVLLPLGVAQALASQWRTRADLGQLTPFEESLGRALIGGRHVQQIASDHSYSDRTIRRKLQGMYLKLGVNNKTGAVRALKALGY